MSDFNLEDLFNIGYGSKDVTVGKHTFSLRTLSTSETSYALQLASTASRFRVQVGVDADNNPVYEDRINEVAWLDNSAKNVLNTAITHIDGKSTEGIDLIPILEKLHQDILMFLYQEYQELENSVTESVESQIKK